MAVSNKKRKAVIRDYPGKSISDLSGEHGLSKREITSILRESGKVPPRSFKVPLLVAGAVLGAACLLAPAYFFITRPGLGKLMSARGHLNVLVVTIDTCRADHLGCYGSAGAKTPRLDALADSGVLFEHCFSLQPLTLPSHSTIFTGAHPAHHGVLDNGVFRLSEQADTLAETLSEQGFTTAAVLASYVLHHRFGLSQGFKYYDDRLSDYRRTDAAGFDEMQAAAVSDRAVGWIERNADQRWFLWLHYFDPHADYLPPAKYREGVPTAYDGEIAYVDFELGRVLDAISKQGLHNRTLVIVTADHGESLSEHGEPTHGMFLYDSVLHVPLIVSLPGVFPGGRRVSRDVSLMEITPTVLDVLGIAAPASVQGRSLMPLLFSDPEKWEDRPVLMETEAPWFEHGWSPSQAIREAGFKFIKAPRPELYDLSVDPGELDNIYAENKGRAEAMARQLKQERDELAAFSIAADSQTRMDEESKQKLESLGYVFTGGKSREASPDAPDAKDMIGVLDMMIRASALKKAGNIEEAINVLEQVLSMNPNDRRTLNRLGTWHAQTGNFEKAETYLKKLIKLDPDFADAYINLGNVYTDTDRFEQARIMAESVLARDPGSSSAYSLLGMIRFRQKDYQGAVKFFRKAIEIFPTFDEAYANMGAAYYYLGEKDKALAAFQAAHRIVPGNARYNEFIRKLTGESPAAP